MQAILKKLIKLINNNSPRRVIPDTRKLFWNDSTQRSIITRNATIIIAFLALTVNGLVYFTSPAFADGSASLTFTVNVPSDSLLEIKLFNADGTEMGSNASMNVVPSMSAAGFNEKEVVVSVGTNNEWGYNLMMNIDNTSLVSSSDSNNTIPSLAKRDAAYTCTKDTADTCDFTLNSWGFQIKDDTASQSATNGYIAIPNSIELNKNTTTTNGDPTHILFGSKINAQQAPGAYSTTINFVATANPKPTPIMQNISNDTLAELIPNTGDTVVVKDSRDGTKYTIGRLADGKVWMLDNLALDLTNPTVLDALDATNTDIDTTNDPGALAALKGTTVRDPSSDASGKYATAKVANWTSSSYSYSAPLVNMDSWDTVPQGSDDPLKAETLAGQWKIGGYYNYCAASAGSYCYGNGTSAGTSSGNATSSICPKGWRLPTGNTGEYQTLYSKYNDHTNFRNALHLPLSGEFYSGSALNQGFSGDFWSSTRSNDANMYRLSAGTNRIYPALSRSRYNGYSVRCVAGS